MGLSLFATWKGLSCLGRLSKASFGANPDLGRVLFSLLFSFRIAWLVDGCCWLIIINKKKIFDIFCFWEDPS